jgi:16S rRNA (adenine1518-N6/adenine1519-N6)-dimethyltransferase
VVANIPYHITSPLLRHLFLESPVLPTSATLLIQREVAENICAEGSPSLLTILVRLAGEPRFVRTVSQEAFLPPPEVESAVIHIACNRKLLRPKDDVERILSIAKHAFSKRRKMLRNSITFLPGGEDALAHAGIDPMRRPETLTLEEWMALADAFPSDEA